MLGAVRRRVAPLLGVLLKLQGLAQDGVVRLLHAHELRRRLRAARVDVWVVPARCAHEQALASGVGEKEERRRWCGGWRSGCCAPSLWKAARISADVAERFSPSVARPDIRFWCPSAPIDTFRTFW